MVSPPLIFSGKINHHYHLTGFSKTKTLRHNMLLAQQMLDPGPNALSNSKFI